MSVQFVNFYIIVHLDKFFVCLRPENESLPCQQKISFSEFFALSFRQQTKYGTVLLDFFYFDVYDKFLAFGSECNLFTHLKNSKTVRQQDFLINRFVWITPLDSYIKICVYEENSRENYITQNKHKKCLAIRQTSIPKWCHWYIY